MNLNKWTEVNWSKIPNPLADLEKDKYFTGLRFEPKQIYPNKMRKSVWKNWNVLFFRKKKIL